jgi:hypothetical protein
MTLLIFSLFHVNHTELLGQHGRSLEEFKAAKVIADAGDDESMQVRSRSMFELLCACGCFLSFFFLLFFLYLILRNRSQPSSNTNSCKLNYLSFVFSLKTAINRAIETLRAEMVVSAFQDEAEHESESHSSPPAQAAVAQSSSKTAITTVSPNQHETALAEKKASVVASEPTVEHKTSVVIEKKASIAAKDSGQVDRKASQHREQSLHDDQRDDSNRNIEKKAFQHEITNSVSNNVSRTASKASYSKEEFASNNSSKHSADENEGKHAQQDTEGMERGEKRERLWRVLEVRLTCVFPTLYFAWLISLIPSFLFSDTA